MATHGINMAVGGQVHSRGRGGGGGGSGEGGGVRMDEVGKAFNALQLQLERKEGELSLAKQDIRWVFLTYSLSLIHTQTCMPSKTFGGYY